MFLVIQGAHSDDSDQTVWISKLIQVITVMTLSFPTDRSGQTVQTQIRLLLEEQSDQGLHYLLFHLHHFDKIPFKVWPLCLNSR